MRIVARQAGVVQMGGRCWGVLLVGLNEISFQVRCDVERCFRFMPLHEAKISFGSYLPDNCCTDGWSCVLSNCA